MPGNNVNRSGRGSGRPKNPNQGAQSTGKSSRPVNSISSHGQPHNQPRGAKPPVKPAPAKPHNPIPPKPARPPRRPRRRPGYAPHPIPFGLHSIFMGDYIMCTNALNALERLTEGYGDWEDERICQQFFGRRLCVAEYEELYLWMRGYMRDNWE